MPPFMAASTRRCSGCFLNRPGKSSRLILPSKRQPDLVWAYVTEYCYKGRFASWTSDAAPLKLILVDNPARFYDF